MPRPRVLTLSVAVLTTVTAAVAAGSLAPTATAKPTAPTDYVVMLKGTATDDAAKAAIAKAGGTITTANNKIGYVYVRSTNSAFAQTLNASGAVVGAAKERVIGNAGQRRAGADQVKKFDEKLESQADGRSGGTVTSNQAAAAATTPEPLANRQWDMRMIGATTTGSYAKSLGRKGVRVGVIDTGIDGTHPDIKPNFDRALSRNFTTDIPDIDGPCEVVPSCIDPNDVDDDGHGTHVASTIGSPVNGVGIAGVAPNVTLINIRAGQDSGYFFLKPTLDALTYAGDIGVDVVNMSYYTDPWLFNCVNNPADSPEEQAEQRTVRMMTQRALNYARNRGVLPIAALGNEATDLNNPTSDTSSPDYPEGTAKDRTIDNSCITVPTESKGVVSISSLGQSGRKAYYSNYGTEQTDLSAPGGDVYDTFDNTRDIRGAVLAAMPEKLAKDSGQLDANGEPVAGSAIVRNCVANACSYYQYLQGTSMAAPLAVGVAALVISEHGTRDLRKGGLKLDPTATEAWLNRSAQRRACPQPRLFHYTRVTPAGPVVEADHRCDGPLAKNGFYGRGVVSAYAAVAGNDRS